MSSEEMARPMEWPPIIVVPRPWWIVARDFVLTAMMWIAFLLMLDGEFDPVFGAAMKQLGAHAALGQIGLGGLSTEGNWPAFLRALFPYLGLALVLVVTLFIFAIDTVRRRREALGGPPVPPLALAIQARQAQLSTMDGHVGDAMEARRADLDLVTIDMRTLLNALNELDEAALTDARALKIVNLHVTDDGHYRIQSAK
jgi:hypothetical protein